MKFTEEQNKAVTRALICAFLAGVIWGAGMLVMMLLVL